MKNKKRGGIFEQGKTMTEVKPNIQKRCETEKREKEYSKEYSKQNDEYKRIEDLQKREAKR